MSFDLNPADEDPHLDCQREIAKLTAENSELRAKLEEAVAVMRDLVGERWGSVEMVRACAKDKGNHHYRKARRILAVLDAGKEGDGG